MSRQPMVVIGDCLLDREVEGEVERLSPDAPVPVLDERRLSSRPGGAGLAAALAAGDGWAVTLVTALADDAAGLELRLLLAEHGVEVVDLGLAGATPEKIRLRAGARSLMRLDRGGPRAAAVGRPDGALSAALRGAGAVLVSDYGRGVAAQEDVTQALKGCLGEVPVVWDPHPRGPAPPPGVTVATPNDAEVRRLVPEPAGEGLAEVSRRALALRARWRARSLCVTRGPAGALHVRDSRAPLAVPARPVRGGDPCGAGDRFSSRLAERLGEGAPSDDAVVDAVECAAAFVAAGGACAVSAGGPAPTESERASGAVDLARSVRASGGTVVATGGCFDLLHAGHVRTLEAARRLGDCLIVCLNSDSSVSRLKGRDRPLVNEADRTSVLMALACVDEVLPFDDDTPERALELLRPHLWVKGGDYQGSRLPEQDALDRWGGRTVLVPYVEGRSTTRIIEEASYRA